MKCITGMKCADHMKTFNSKYDLILVIRAGPRVDKELLKFSMNDRTKSGMCPVAVQCNQRTTLLSTKFWHL